MTGSAAVDLLSPMDADQFQAYHDAIIQSMFPKEAALKVVPDVGGGVGKGVVATRGLEAGTRMFTEPPLVGEQHTSNRPQALVCDQCFRYLGPLELQLGFRLLQGHVLDATADEDTSDSLPDDFNPLDGTLDDTRGHDGASCPSDSLQRTALALLRRKQRVPDVEWEPQNGCRSACTGGYIPLHLQQLLRESQGQAYSQFPSEEAAQARQPLLGRAVLLPDGSDYLFCSHDCAALAWSTWAALLSPGPKRHLPAAVRSSVFVEDFDVQQVGQQVWEACTLAGKLNTFNTADSGDLSGRDATSAVRQCDGDKACGSQASAGHCGAQGAAASVALRPPWLPGPCDKHALHAFYEHADSSNDIFRVAARAVAMVASAFHMRVAMRVAMGGGTALKGAEQDTLLLEAWKPFQAVCKAAWWDQVPMPDDLEDEAAWRTQLKSLACESLQLLRTALGSSVPRQLVADEVWGSIIGMFELNNLAVQVQSPLELFFLAVDDLPEGQQEPVQAITQPWLDALDTDYDVYCTGTALYALQSCMNHSSDPNAETTKEDSDMDGKAVISAKLDIGEGEEVLISYVDLDAPESEQRSALRDYGIQS